MLSPDTIDMLDKALAAVVKECGDDPQYTDLVKSLTDAQSELKSDEGANDAPTHADGAERDPADPHGFEAAAGAWADAKKPKTEVPA